VDSDFGKRVDAFFTADQQGMLRNMRQVVMTVDGNIVDEKDNQSSSTATYDIQAIGSAIVATLIGMAIDGGKLRGLDAKLPEMLPSYSAAMNDATGDLLVAILEYVTGQNAVDYARDRLFTPLGIDTEPTYQGPLAPERQAAYDSAGFAWPTDPHGHHLGVAMKFSARQNSRTGGTPVVPVSSSTRRRGAGGQIPIAA
jgi:CubicO group peptidase (beta-lactamase class C family)